MSDDYVSYEKAVARHDDDEWLPKRIYVRTIFVLGLDGTYGFIAWRDRGRFEVRGFASRAHAEDAANFFPFGSTKPGEYATKLAMLVNDVKAMVPHYQITFVRPAQPRYH